MALSLFLMLMMVFFNRSTGWCCRCSWCWYGVQELKSVSTRVHTPARFLCCLIVKEAWPAPSPWLHLEEGQAKLLVLFGSWFCWVYWCCRGITVFPITHNWGSITHRFPLWTHTFQASASQGRRGFFHVYQPRVYRSISWTSSVGDTWKTKSVEMRLLN